MKSNLENLSAVESVATASCTKSERNEVRIIIPLSWSFYGNNCNYRVVVQFEAR